MRLFLIIFFIPLSVFSQSIMNPDRNDEKTSLNKFLYLYEDKTANLSFENIKDNPDILFEKNKKKYLSYGLTSSAVWGKFFLSARPSENKWYLISDFTILDRLDLYVPDRNYNCLKAGNLVPFKERTFNHRNLVIPFNPETSRYPYYFRVRSIDDTLDIQLSIHSYIGLLNSLEFESSIFNLLLGIVVLITFYNFVIFVVTKDKTYLLYLVYAVLYWITRLQINGYIYQYIFPDNYPLAQWARNIGANFAAGFALLFGVYFMKLNVYFPRFTKFIYAAAIALFVNGTFIRALAQRIQVLRKEREELQIQSMKDEFYIQS